MLPGHQFGIACVELLRSTLGLHGPEPVDLGFIDVSAVVGIKTGQQARSDHRAILCGKCQGFLEQALSCLRHVGMVPRR